ncbi:MAG TPA: HAMP domain-containing sensor histidine kinase [Spirochaetota bacterium]|nr:HAMP domain-containing sensor histidine kinase [Spirochaetota bacterium]HOM38307.1 HAMP domain-containing sensor histidine kinase [Spirochaetota bacterium]HPQ48475.1 HAMP domain-containing sensor histidine kinase [Spirochaetota bacterium]
MGLFDIPENVSFLKSLPSEIDISEEVNNILEFFLDYLQKIYGFEGIGVQIVDYHNKVIKFYKIWIPSYSNDRIEKLKNIEIPLEMYGGICPFVVKNNFIVYFEDLSSLNIDLNYISSYDLFALKLLKHISHLIIPVDFENKVVLIIQISSFSRKVLLKKEEIEKIKKVAINIGRVLYKTLKFKDLYQENQKLMIDILNNKKARDTFLAGINHEFKTPLNAIIGFSEYLMKTKNIDLEKLHNISSIIHKNGEVLLSIIKEIIEVYKIDSGKVSIEKIKFNIKDVIEDTISSLYPLYSKKKHKIIKKLQDVDIESDKQKIYQLLYNIISNAIKYTKEKGKIEIGVEKEENLCKIYVKDNGIGISESDIPNLFIPFKRGANSYSMEEGSGLGLFICSQIIKVLKGDIKVESTLGKGSKFIIELPYRI